METPIVSIITPSYNSEKFIAETIKSVISQTYKNWEMIIVDDCSQDNSIDIIEQLIKDENRIILHKLTENGGVAKARNYAIEHAKGNYIAFLDSDDLWVPEKLEEQISFMQQNGFAFTYANYQLMNEDGTIQDKVINCPISLSYNDYLKNTAIGCLTVVINKKIVGDFKVPIIRSSQDMATWLLILKKGYNAHCLNKVLAYYRIVQNSNSSKKIKAAKDVWMVYRKFENLSMFYAVFCFTQYVYNAIKKRL